MKNAKIIISLIIGLIIGVLGHKYFMDDGGHGLVNPVRIQTTADAERLVNNYNLHAENAYFYVSDSMLMQMNYVKTQVNSGTGFVVHTAASQQSDQYDLVIYARCDENLNEIENYYRASRDNRNYGLCPNVCDVTGPLPH